MKTTNSPGEQRATGSPGRTVGPGRSSSTRRAILSWGAVGVAVTAAYGTFGAFFARFLNPGRADRSWLFVTRSIELPAGAARRFTTPAGATVNITRQGETDEDLVALSSVCPHLGCQVHWEEHNDRFFCPCHNGVFDPTGVAIAGPPADADQSLLQYPLKTDRGMVFIELSANEVALGGGYLAPASADLVQLAEAPCTPCTAPTGTRRGQVGTPTARNLGRNS